MNEYRYTSFERMQLSVWCNVFGPKVDMLWLIKDKDERSTYVARHTLNGEEGMKPESAMEETRFHVFSEEGIVSLTRLFSAPYQKGKARYALSITFNSTLLGTLLELMAPIKEFLVSASKHVSKLLHEKGDRRLKYRKVEKVFGNILPLLDDLMYIVHVRREAHEKCSRASCDMSKFESGHKSEFSTPDVPFSQQRERAASTSSYETSSSSGSKGKKSSATEIPILVTPLSVMNKEAFEADIAHENLFPSVSILQYLRLKLRFMAKAVTSHLQTRCCSLIVGNNRSRVEKFTKMFSVFAPASDSHLISYFNERYIPNLRIQGIHRSQYYEELLLLSQSPSTVIDIDHSLVFQSEILFFYDNRKRFIKRIFEISSDSPMTEKLLTKFERSQCSLAVEKMLESACELGTDSHAASYLRNHLDLFLRKAIVLLNVVLYTNLDVNRFRDKKFRASLGIESKEDYLIYLSFVDRIWPGFYMRMAFKSLFVLNQLDLLM